MDIQSYYIIVREASDKLRSQGMICPEIKVENIIVDKVSGEPYYALDLGEADENRFHYSLRQLDEIIDEMLGREDKPMPRTFKVHFDDNFSKEIPRCWYEKSKKENAFKDFDLDGNLISKKQQDEYKTYDDIDMTIQKSSPKPVATEPPSNDPVTETGTLSDMDEILNSCIIEKMPNTYD